MPPKRSDKKYFGPGKWDTIHLIAYRAVDQESMNFFRRFMQIMAEEEKCGECKMHMDEYIRANPIEQWFWRPQLRRASDGRMIGCFMWSVNFHNAVNARLSKKGMTFEEAMERFEQTEVCMGDCGETQTSGDSSGDDRQDQRDQRDQQRNRVERHKPRLNLL